MNKNHSIQKFEFRRLIVKIGWKIALEVSQFAVIIVMHT